MKCSCGKKFFAPALFAAALSLALLFGCSSGGDEEAFGNPGNMQDPSQGGTQGGVQNPVAGGNAGGEQTPGQGEEQPGEGENPGGEIVVPPLEYSCEITSISMPNESISPKRVSEILGALAFDYVLTASTGEIYQGWHASYGNFPEEIRNEIRFIEVTEKGDVERDGEYEFPSGQENVAFEIWHGGESKFERTLKNGNYDYSKVLETIAALLKEIIGQADYDAISAEVAAGNLTLTAENIKAVGDIFPALEKDAESGKEAKDVENAAAILQNKEAFVAQAEGEVAVRFGPIYPDWYEEYPFLFDEEAAEKKYVVTYKANVKFTDTFNLSEISLPDNNGKGDFTTATLKGKEVNIDKLNTIRGSSLPTLEFSNVTDNNLYVAETSAHLYNLYKDYSDNLGKLTLNGNINGMIDGAKDKNGNFINGYTLFTNDNKAKPSTDTSVKSLPIDALILMYKNLGINYFVNMIISGTPTNPAEVDWTLTNMIFEGDMSKITNKGNGTLNGIVYFKNKPYKNDGQRVNGMLKLDSLDGVSKNTLKISPNSSNGVLDVRGVDKKTIEDYNSSILYANGYTHAIYFSDDFIDLKDKQEEINKLCDKFSSDNSKDRRFFNAYLGDYIVHGQSYDATNSSSVIGAKTPRKLSEFEYFGNYEKFEKSARSTYNENELSDPDKGRLDNDEGFNQIAQNNKRCFFCVAKSFV